LKTKAEGKTETKNQEKFTTEDTEKKK